MAERGGTGRDGSPRPGPLLPGLLDLGGRAAGLAVRTSVAAVAMGAGIVAGAADEALRALVRAAADRLDVDRLAGRIDIDRLAGRIDIDRLADRIDLGELLARVDLDALASRIDLDALMARLDLDALVGRLDLVGLAEQVIDEVGLPDIIRDSTNTMAAEAVEGLRLHTLRADEAVSDLVGRLLRRDGPRPPGPEADGGGPGR